MVWAWRYFRGLLINSVRPSADTASVISKPIVLGCLVSEATHAKINHGAIKTISATSVFILVLCARELNQKTKSFIGGRFNDKTR
jgi:hypothetical protein